MTKARTNADNVTADIAGITAGTGITGGGTSGTVTVTNSMATAIDAAGDLIYGTGSDAFTRLGLGTAGQLLKVNSGATAPEWGAAPESGGMTLLSTTTLSGATTTISSIPSGYNYLYLNVKKYLPVNDGAYLRIRYNGDAGANRYSGNSITGDISGAFNSTEIYITDGTNNSGAIGNGVTIIYDYASTDIWKVNHTLAYNLYTNGTSFGVRYTANCYNQTTAITSIEFSTNDGNISSGTAYLYGVK